MNRKGGAYFFLHARAVHGARVTHLRAAASSAKTKTVRSFLMAGAWTKCQIRLMQSTRAIIGSYRWTKRQIRPGEKSLFGKIK